MCTALSVTVQAHTEQVASHELVSKEKSEMSSQLRVLVVGLGLLRVRHILAQHSTASQVALFCLWASSVGQLRIGAQARAATEESLRQSKAATEEALRQARAATEESLRQSGAGKEESLRQSKVAAEESLHVVLESSARYRTCASHKIRRMQHMRLKQRMWDRWCCAVTVQQQVAKVRATAILCIACAQAEASGEVALHRMRAGATRAKVGKLMKASAWSLLGKITSVCKIELCLLQSHSAS